MKTPVKTTNVLLGAIAIILVILIIILLQKQKVQAPIVGNPDPAHTAAEKDVDLKTETVEKKTNAGANENFVHPPAEGKFVSDGVQNFVSSYNKSTRIMTIEADVSKSFFFEASAAYKVYNADGVAIVENGFQPILAPGEDYISSPKSHLHAKIIFTVPPTVRNGEIMVFRFIADNPSGLDQYAGYWGTTIKAQ